MNNYAYAPDVLPASLLAEIRKYFPEGHLWIPKESAVKALRGKQIVTMFSKGMSFKDISGELGMTIKEVKQILQELTNES